MTTLEAALDYARHGWRVVPIMAGSKRPALTRWTEQATTDPATIKEWWDGHDDYGVGIATGPASGMWVLDVDDYDSFRDLELRYEPLPATRTSITGSGGYHFLFRWPEGRDVRNDAGRRLGPGLDVRGDGGQIVTPPSVHPTGTTYEWDAGEPSELADAPEWLLDLVCVDTAPEPVERPAVASGDRPGDQWAAATTWADLLTRDGWQLHHVDRDGEHHWTRPGKELRDGTSATTGYKGADVLKVFTSSMRAAGLDEEQTYSKLGYLAATRFDGDHSAAASALSSQGWGSHAEDPFDTDAFRASVAVLAERTLAQLPDVVETTPDDEGHWQFVDLAPILDGTWDPPTPTLLTRSDGVGLIYPGRVHSLAGEPGGGKTWVALHFLADTLNGGGTAMLIDYEDTPASAVARLRALGVADDVLGERFAYVRPDGPLIDRQGRVAGLTMSRLEAVDPDAVVIDSIGESLASEGLKPNDDDDVTRWFRLLPRRLARGGAAVLGVDHMAKDRDSRGLWAIGSQRKLAAIDGAAYVAEVKTAPTKHRDGHLNLLCAKDRHGTHQRGEMVAAAHIVNADSGVRIRFDAPASKFRPTTLMERVSIYLEDTPTSSTRAVLLGVSGKDKHVRQALDILLEEGYVDCTPGGRGGQQWSSVQPFRAPDDELEIASQPVDNPTAAHRGPPRPDDSGRGPETTAAPAARGLRSSPGPGPRSDTSGHHSEPPPRPAAPAPSPQATAGDPSPPAEDPDEIPNPFALTDADLDAVDSEP